MGTRLAWWVLRENSYFRETLGESVPVGPRIGVFGACSRALLPEIEGQAQVCDLMGVVERPCGYPAG